MKDQIEFAIMLFCLGWGAYKCFQKRSERLLYVVIFSANIFSTGYPLHIPLEFALSFNGFFGFAVLLYKSLSINLETKRCFKEEALNSTFTTVKFSDGPFENKPTAHLKKSLLRLAFLSLFFGILFLAQGLTYPNLSIPAGSITLISLEFALSLCGFLGFGVLLRKISQYKLDKTFIIFDLILLLFGITSLIQGLFMMKNIL